MAAGPDDSLNAVNTSYYGLRGAACLVLTKLAATPQHLSLPS